MTEGEKDLPMGGHSSILVSCQQGQLQRDWKRAGVILWGSDRKNGFVGVVWGRKSQVSDSAPHMTLPSTLCPIMGTWTKKTLQGIRQSRHSAHVQVKGPMCTSSGMTGT